MKAGKCSCSVHSEGKAAGYADALTREDKDEPKPSAYCLQCYCLLWEGVGGKSFSGSQAAQGASSRVELHLALDTAKLILTE